VVLAKFAAKLKNNNCLGHMFPDQLKIIDPTLTKPDKLDLPELRRHGLAIDVLRLDKIHPVISGNKWFKLKEHLQIACAGNFRRIVTFGGAWSNHIVATAYAARSAGFGATGIIRGEEHAYSSDALQAAAGYGMNLQFISRKEYGRRDEPDFLERLAADFPDAYIIPEGGAGHPGIKGSGEIGQWIEMSRYSHIVCAIGTGTMFLGLASASLPGQNTIGIPVLKGLRNFLSGCEKWLPDPAKLARCSIRDDYHFGGYARKSEALLDFMRRFHTNTGIPTDFVYTGKLCYAALDMVDKGFFPRGSQILLIHSGGLQGNRSLPEGVLNF
jgi:1-aminocyclopropane-1-carboxylate deaminase